ncbi:hypothetical protein GKIL_2123 [Gloeobacter kilaueensis JS1]|uniref:Addiction module toxin RelE n=2 Tax=Gloeobacter TaxID=33071 RepID=U5QLA8_GLOK1|nr:hypothetical protein GKIL_2123 [Gloeobacter kilaueensis JS1]
MVQEPPPWEVIFHDEFRPEFDALDEDVQLAILASAKNLKKDGPRLGRPKVDTLNGSKFANMKELQISEDGPWRVAFAFDPKRRAVLLWAGNKSGMSEDLFYKTLLRHADKRYDQHREVVEAELKQVRQQAEQAKKKVNGKSFPPATRQKKRKR